MPITRPFPPTKRASDGLEGNFRRAILVLNSYDQRNNRLSRLDRRLTRGRHRPCGARNRSLDLIYRASMTLAVLVRPIGRESADRGRTPLVFPRRHFGRASAQCSHKPDFGFDLRTATMTTWHKKVPLGTGRGAEDDAEARRSSSHVIFWEQASEGNKSRAEGVSFSLCVCAAFRIRVMPYDANLDFLTVSLMLNGDDIAMPFFPPSVWSTSYSQLPRGRPSAAGQR